MNHDPETYVQRQRDVCRGTVDAGPKPKGHGKKKKARLGTYCMPRAFIAHEFRSELQHEKYWL